ncbi:MAG: aquaporin Z [Gomphosphaeria aponina SAG 52.96 = DSM 107014]|uniref:Aquaporin Z n=1 Tax=Gomphosphaeria aponina SAG 52.96 = DSM 107014 TaxID=1521640 RepID=A0A941JT27_9CHRO|nr:aquaporin Z [Gomphosphaeria aponina SAG 52.96 = DSM 107014]
MKKYLAEFLGTFWLVLGGCGSAVIAAAYTETSIVGSDPETQFAFSSGIGVLGVALAFGLTVLSMAYAVGHISGGHFNPAVSFGLFAAKRFPGSQLLPYIVAQVVGAIVAGLVLNIIAHGQPNFVISPNDSNPLATNGYGLHSPDGYNLFACLITEVLMTFMFLIIILGSTDRLAPQGFAPIPIGLGLTLIHLISIPVTNTSVNPARSTGVALFAGPELIVQLWLFWFAPILGAVLAGFVYATLMEEPIVKNISE